MSPAAVSSEETAHEVVEEILPEGFEWDRLVRRYPIPALLLAATGGFVLARARGEAILAALGAFAASRVTDEVHRVLGEEILEPE